MAKVQSRDIRDALLTNAPEMLTRLINYASGFEVLEDGSRGEYNGELDVDALMTLTTKALPLMNLEDDQLAVDTKQARANTIDELMEMRRKGQISDKQLTQYTGILKTNYEITELNQLIEKIEQYEGV